MNHRVRSLINIVCFLAVLAVNYLANALPLNGVTQKELSAEYSIHITPAGYVFAIWGIIYSGLLTYIVLQALPKWISKTELRILDFPFIMSCGCNVLWLIFWHYRYLSLSVILMLGLLSSLIIAHMRMQQSMRKPEGTYLLHRCPGPRQTRGARSGKHRA